MPAIEPSTTRVPAAVAGEMNPSPQGRLPKAPRAFSSPASGMAVRPSRPRRRSLPLAQVTLASEAPVRRSATAPPLRRRLLHVGAHHAGEHLGGHAGKGGDPGAGLARGLAGRGVGERLDRRRQDDIGCGHRRRQGRGRLARMRLALRHHGQDGVGPRILGLAAKPLPQPLRGRVADHQHLLAGRDAETVADHRPHSLSELIGHAERLFPRRYDSPPRRSSSVG